MCDVENIHLCIHACIRMTTVMDDVISLALLAEVKALSGTGSGDSDEAGDGGSDNSASASSSTSTWALTKPVVASLGSIFVGVLLTHLLPPYIARVNAYFCPPKRGPFQFVSVIGLAVLFGYLCALVGSSDLMGCFFAGLLFSELNHDQVNTRDRGSLGTHGQSGVSLRSPVRVEGKQLQRQEEGEDDTIDVHPDRKCGSDKSDRSCNDSDISIDLSGDLHERGSSKSNDDDTNGNVSGNDNENKFSEGRLKQRATTRSRSRQHNAPGNPNHGDGNDDHELDGGSVRDDLEVQPVGIAIPLSQMWTVHVFPVQSWLTKLFFASTIAFGIPKLYKSGGLFEAQAIWRGLLLTCCSIIGT